MSKQAQEKRKRGPKPDSVVLEGPWEDRVRDSFKAGPMPKKGMSKPKRARKSA